MEDMIMQKKKLFKRISALFCVLTLCLSMSGVAFASETDTTSTVTSLESSEDTVVPKAISGSTTITTGDYAESTIYSPGWSIWGHAEVTVTGAPVALSIIGPDGNSCIDGGVVMLNPGANQRVGMINTNHRGNYIVKVQAYSGVATVTVTLKDF